MEASTIKFMFLGATVFEGNKVVRGAILLTDEKTVPLEFRCTDPIRPSDLQRTLYGKILDEHVLIELIGIPLFRASNTVPEIVVVPTPKLLGLRTRIDHPVVAITRDPSQLNSSEGSSTIQMRNSRTEKLDSVYLSSDPEVDTDLDLAEDLFRRFGNQYDFVEPFSRLTQALEQIHDLKVGDSQ